MRLLVLGGTLFVSREIAAEAARRGHEVVCACRGTGELPAGVRHVPLDRTAQDPADVLEGPYDAVVDVARQPSWVRSAVAALPEAHWVFVSSISVYADHGTPGGRPDRLPLLDPIREDRDLAADPDAYGGLKVACEEVVLEGAAASLVVRPGLIVGPGDPTGRFTYWPVRLAVGGPTLAPGAPDDPVQVLDVRDLAGWLVDAAERRSTGVLEAVGPVTSRRDLLLDVARGVGAEPELVWVGSERLAGFGVEPWAGPSSLPVWLPGDDHAGMLAHDPEPAAAAGLAVRPIAETARDTLAWFRATPGALVTGIDRAREATILREVAAGERPGG